MNFPVHSFPHFLSLILLVAGGLFCVVGGLGLIRLPDFYTRTHAGGLTDTLGAALILVGLMLQTQDLLIIMKLMFILLFLFFTSPTSAHALARAAFTHGLKPILHDQSFDESLREGDIPTDLHAPEKRKDGETSP